MSHKLCFWWQNNEQHCHTCTHHITSHMNKGTKEQTNKWMNKFTNKQTHYICTYSYYSTLSQKQMVVHILLITHQAKMVKTNWLVCHCRFQHIYRNTTQTITNKYIRVIIRQHVLRHMRDIDMSEWVSMCCKSWTTYSVHESFETRLTNTTIKYLADTICALVVTNRFRRKWALSQASRQLKYIAHPKRFQSSFRGKSSKMTV